MGVDYNAGVVAGVLLGDLKPVTRQETTTVVRYDNVTGAPYDVTVEQLYTKIGKVEIKGTLRDALKRFNGDFEAEEEIENEFGKKSPASWSGSYISDIRNDNDLLNQVVVGYCVSKKWASSGWAEDMTRAFEQADASSAMTKMEHWLAENGLEDVVPRLFVVMQASY
jgi:hypothetical protein